MDGSTGLAPKPPSGDQPERNPLDEFVRAFAPVLTRFRAELRAELSSRLDAIEGDLLGRFQGAVEEVRRQAERDAKGAGDALRQLAELVTAETRALPDRLLHQVSLLPRPRDGQDGHLTPVADYSPRTWQAGECCHHRGGLWQAVERTSTVPAPDNRAWRVVAEGIDSFVAEQDAADPRGLSFSHWLTGGDEHRADLVLPIPLHRGTYASDATYVRNDMVALDGGCWICTAETTTAAPPSPEWQLVASRGSRGRSGAQGPQGEQGEKGDPGPQGRVGSSGARGEAGPRGRGIAGVEEIAPSIIQLQFDDGEVSNPIPLPGMRFVGVYVPGQTYSRGDLVRLGYHLFACVETTDSVPGTNNPAWALLIPGNEPSGAGGVQHALQFLGIWEVAANIPDLIGVTAKPGEFYTCATADTNVPETAPAGIPGIGGQVMTHGDVIIWAGPSGGAWQRLASHSLTRPEADAVYVFKAGDTMTGDLDVLGNTSSDFFICPREPGGYVFGPTAQDGGLYKQLGGGLLLRQPSGNQRLRAERNDGQESYEIVDARGGTFHWPGTGNVYAPPLNWTDDGGWLARISGGRDQGSDQLGAFQLQVNIGDADPPDWQTALRTRQSLTDPVPRIELAGDPVEDLDAVTKRYADAAMPNPVDGLVYGRRGGATPEWARAVDLAGDMMTGQLIVTSFAPVPGFLSPSRVVLNGAQEAILTLQGDNAAVVDFQSRDQSGVSHRQWVIGTTDIGTGNYDLIIAHAGGTPGLEPRFRFLAGGPIQSEIDLNFHKPGDTSGASPWIRFHDSGRNMGFVYGTLGTPDNNYGLVVRGEERISMIVGQTTFMRTRGIEPDIWLSNLRDPEQPEDAATMRYVDTEIAAAISVIPPADFDPLLPRDGSRPMTGPLTINTALLGYSLVVNNTSTAGTAEAVLISNENKGITWETGRARIYKRQNEGLVINSGVGNIQPRIEDLNEINRRDILDVSYAGRSQTVQGPLLLDANVPIVDAQQLVTKDYADRLQGAGSTFLIGVIDAATGFCRYVPSFGYTDGPLIDADVAGAGAYLICTTAGNVGLPPGVTSLEVGDWLASGGLIWFALDIGGGAAAAANVSLTPPVFGQSDVQAAMEEAETRDDARVLRQGDTMLGALSLHDDPTAEMHAIPLRYLETRFAERGLFIWTAGASYQANQAVLYDNRSFRTLVAIPSAPATPDFTTISPMGYGQADYWTGARDNTNGEWAVDSWVHIVSVPAYGVYRIEITDLHTGQDTALLVDLVTGWNSATATLVGHTRQGTGSWKELRVSQTGNATAARVELQIAAVGGAQNFKITVNGETRGTTVNQVAIQKPLVASLADIGGNTRARIEGLNQAAFSTSHDIITGLGRTVKFLHGNPTDINDGKIGARLFGPGLNIVGSATEATGTEMGRQIGFWGAVSMRQAGDITFIQDNNGITFSGGARLWKASGTQLVFKCPSFLQIENIDGTNRRPVLDADNGVRKAGDTMTGGLSLGTANAASVTDLSRHLNIYAAGASGMGLNATPNQFNFIVPNVGNEFRWYGSGVERLVLRSTGLTVGANAGYFLPDAGGLVQRGTTRTTLRCTIGDNQPQIENNNGGNPRDIIDTQNGDLRYFRISEMGNLATTDTTQTITARKVMTQPITIVNPTADNEGVPRGYADARYIMRSESGVVGMTILRRDGHGANTVLTIGQVLSIQNIPGVLTVAIAAQTGTSQNHVLDLNIALAASTAGNCAISIFGRNCVNAGNYLYTHLRIYRIEQARIQIVLVARDSNLGNSARHLASVSRTNNVGLLASFTDYTGGGQLIHEWDLTTDRWIP